MIEEVVKRHNKGEWFKPDGEIEEEIEENLVRIPTGKSSEREHLSETHISQPSQGSLGQSHNPPPSSSERIPSPTDHTPDHPNPARIAPLYPATNPGSPSHISSDFNALPLMNVGGGVIPSTPAIPAAYQPQYMGGHGSVDDHAISKHQSLYGGIYDSTALPTDFHNVVYPPHYLEAHPLASPYDVHTGTQLTSHRSYHTSVPVFPQDVHSSGISMEVPPFGHYDWNNPHVSMVEGMHAGVHTITSDNGPQIHSDGALMTTFPGHDTYGSVSFPLTNDWQQGQHGYSGALIGEHHAHTTSSVNNHFMHGGSYAPPQ
ncbi:hypothetical protein H0H93_011458 [Arthromyces matolae]|nr:hypothetical protein H0H93_011458 [Arthromyces matolae]